MWSSSANASKPATPLGKVDLEAAADIRLVLSRIFVTLVYEMKKRNAKRGLATLCIDGGMGVALTVERG